MSHRAAGTSTDLSAVSHRAAGSFTDLPVVPYRAAGTSTDLPANTHPDANLPTVTNLSIMPHQDAGAGTNLPAETYSDANLCPVPCRIPGDLNSDGDADRRANLHTRADGAAFAYPYKAGSGDA